jgi:flavin-dependent dehydrogenase
VSPEGERTRIAARFVVDASGRDALLARASRGAAPIDGLDQTALYAHFEGVPRQPGRLEGDVEIVLFRESPGARASWFWIIPFKDGRASVGAVVSRAWMRQRRGASGGADAAASGTDLDSLFAAAVAASSTATELLAGARMLWPRVEAAADFSYRVRDIQGPGWIALGDAAGFIDPLFSTGVHLALTGGARAADAIVESLAGAPAEPSGRDRDAPLVAWASAMRAASDVFLGAVEAFYAGPLLEYLFIEDKRVALRRSIASLLAGDVFHDAVWLRETRKRIAEWNA